MMRGKERMAKKKTEEAEQTVRVFLPLLESDETAVAVDQTESVTINGRESITLRRGQSLEVPASVFLLLKNKYPQL